MAETKIEWADYTFNPWVGCTKISPACDHCYAETWAKRAGHPELWQGQRRRTSDANWKQPLKWDRAAKYSMSGRRPKVFCASLADVFDNQADPQWRSDLFQLIEDTPNLDWLLLTKRPQNIERMSWPRWDAGWPRNIWLGTTVENQEQANLRIPHLLTVPTRIHFLSCEPLLGPLDLRNIQPRDRDELNALAGFDFDQGLPGHAVDWVIAGGESGPKARLSHPDWFRSLRDQCADAGAAFFFKQWGEWLLGKRAQPFGAGRIDFGDGSHFEVLSDATDILLCCAEDHHGEPARIWREYWASGDGQLLKKLGKKAAGRLLDGVEHNGMPA